MTSKEVKGKVKALAERMRAEFKGSSFGSDVTVLNEYKESGKEWVTVRVRVDQLNELEVRLGMMFPAEAPIVWVTEPTRSSVIDWQTRQVRYESFYQWRTDSSLLDLVTVIQNYFRNVPPICNEELRRAFRIQKEVVNSVNDSWTEGLITKIEKDRSNSKTTEPLSLSEVKRYSPELVAADKKTAALIDLAERLADEIDSEIVYLQSLKEATVPTIIEFKFAKMSLVDTAKQFRSEVKVSS